MHRPHFLFIIMTITLLSITSASHAGYFLTWPQKGELLVTGGVTDSAGNTYDVTILPGYLSMLDFSGNSWTKGWKLQTGGGIRFAKGLLRVPVSLKYFRDYITPNPWRGMGEGVKQCGEGERYLFTEYMGKNVGATWNEYMGRAANANSRKSFGWWFAYPWATVKGVVNTSLRYVTGVPASAVVLSYGICLRPAWELSFPILKTGKDVIVNTADATYGVLQTSWGLAVNQALFGVATPVSGYVWTTAVGVPMSLLGKAPSPQSADGWWVVVTSQVAPAHSIALPDSSTIISIGKQFEYKQMLELQRASIEQKKHSTLAPYKEQYTILKTQLDSIQQIIYAEEKPFDQAVEEIERADTNIDFPDPPPEQYTSELTFKEEDSLRLYMYRIMKEHTSDTSHLFLSRLNSVATSIVSTWNRQPPTQYQKRQVKKQDPNRLIQTEMEQIME